VDSSWPDLRLQRLNAEGSNGSFYLLTPERLPRGRAEYVAAGDAAAALEIMSACPPDCRDESALVQARTAISRLNLDHRLLMPAGGDANESQNNRSNDRAFGIVRVRGEAMPILIHSTLQGFVALLEEAIAGGANVNAEDWTRLRSAFHLLFHILRNGSWAAPDRLNVPIEPPRAADQQHSALSRWIRGHHMFMVLIQGLVAAFSSFQEEIEAARLGPARDALRAATCLMVGSGVALHFTGDFPYSDYEREVRPTLMPPLAPNGLTGLYWRDHEYLMKVLTRLRPVFTRFDPFIREQLHSFHEALRQTYGSHKVVCARFVGTAQPSLLMANRIERSAVDTLDHFMRVRLNLVKL